MISKIDPADITLFDFYKFYCQTDDKPVANQVEPFSPSDTLTPDESRLVKFCSLICNGYDAGEVNVSGKIAHLRALIRAYEAYSLGTASRRQANISDYRQKQESLSLIIITNPEELISWLNSKRDGQDFLKPEYLTSRQQTLTSTGPGVEQVGNAVLRPAKIVTSRERAMFLIISSIPRVTGLIESDKRTIMTLLFRLSGEETVASYKLANPDNKTTKGEDSAIGAEYRNQKLEALNIIKERFGFEIDPAIIAGRLKGKLDFASEAVFKELGLVNQKK